MRLFRIQYKKQVFWTYASDRAQAQIQAKWQYDKKLTKCMLAIQMIRGTI